MGPFPVRQAIERLRAGLFDPVAVARLTMEEESIGKNFAKGLAALEKGQAGHLCVSGSYGQGKSHHLTYLQGLALAQGVGVSFVQLDVREVPFYQFPVVYQSLMKNLTLPTGESFAASWKKRSCEVPEGAPHRFRMILQAMVSKNKFPMKKKGLKPRDFDHWLEEAFMGRSLPISSLKQILKARGGAWDPKEPLACRGNLPYLQMVQSLGKLLHDMGHKGLVLFFDEAESIAEGRLKSRSKSYDILHQLFFSKGFVYPVFAFTPAFFDQVRREEYGGEAPQFSQNYAEGWKSLQVVKLSDFSSSQWEILQDRLIDLYAEGYQVDLTPRAKEIKQQMGDFLEKVKGQETRFKLKAFIHQLDIICTRTAS